MFRVSQVAGEGPATQCTCARASRGSIDAKDEVNHGRAVVRDRHVDIDGVRAGRQTIEHPDGLAVVGDARADRMRYDPRELREEKKR